jgi:hypothetical protein
MPLQSGIFSINRNTLIGLVSSIITAAMGYGVRLILIINLEYDIFTNLDHLIPSLSYFCSLGGIRFVLNEYLKQNTYLKYYCGGIDPAGYNSPMQATNGPGIGSSGASLPSEDRLKLEKKILKVEKSVSYFKEQLEGFEQDLHNTESQRSVYREMGKLEE